MPKKGGWSFSVLFLAVAGAGLCYGAVRFVQWMTVPEIRKPTVVAAPLPQSRTAAEEACPIALPADADDVRYAVWSMGSVTQSWVRFEAPPEVSLRHAESILKEYEEQEGWSVATAPISGDTGVVCVLDPTEVDLSWFEPADLPGTVFRVTGGRAPVIWVDTNRGTFYCEVKNDLHSLSPK